MSFLSFNEKYYLEKTEFYENKRLSPDEIIELKRIYKVLDDLEAEGYSTLSAHLESKFRCKSRLKDILNTYSEEPFPVPKSETAVVYGKAEFEIEAFIDELIASKHPYFPNSDFLREIAAYADWIGYDEDTAYVFLLRDALLPYVWFVSRGRKHLYPWLIGRAFIDRMAEEKNADDEIRLPIYDALESGIEKFAPFAAFCKERILKTLTKYPKLRAALCDLLGTIPEKKICVVESGYCGTVPMLLSALDERVDFRLYSTAPFLYKVYGNKIFCRKYENIREFETLSCCDKLFRFSNFDGKFYVNVAPDTLIRKKALGEIYAVTQFD